MKHQTLLLSLFLLSAPSLIATPEDRTANAVKARAESLADEKVSVETTHVTAVRRPGDDQVSVFEAHTYDTGENLPAGNILVAVKKEDVDAFVKKFGTTPEVGAVRPIRNRETTRLAGTLKLTAKKVPYIDLTDGLVNDALLGKEAAAPDEIRDKVREKIKERAKTPGKGKPIIRAKGGARVGG